MEEETNESGTFVSIPENNIRSAQVNIQGQLESLKITSDTTYEQTSYFCDSVRDHILNYDDEPHLSKNQNNCRRIFIASELFINICSTYAQIVDYEYGKIISGMVQWEKFKQLSRKISSKMHVELKREKYFSKEAQGKLLESLDDVVEEVNEVPKEAPPRREIESEIVTGNEREKLPVNEELVPIPEETIPGQVIHETLTSLDLETSVRDDFPSHIIGNITDIREDFKTDTHLLEPPLSNISRHELALPRHQTLDPELSIGDPTIQQKTYDDIEHILSSLEDIFPKDVIEPEQSEKIIELSVKEPEISEELMTKNTANGGVTPVNTPEDSEEWSLPSIEAVEKTKKKRSLIIDKTTFIPSYASKAMQLNRNIEIQRVQVFEGPPRLLQAITADYLMTTPGYKPVSLRSSRLSTIFNRQLKVEKRTVEAVIPQRSFKSVEVRQVMDMSKARVNGDILEDVGVRAGMRSIFEKSGLLVEAGEKTLPQDLETMGLGAPPLENLMGIPLSRIINGAIEPPHEAQMERINAAPILSTPRVKQLQGKSIEPSKSPPWFLYTKENPPRAKCRKFNYVFERLQNHWSFFESQGMEKCISLSEFFSFEKDPTRADFLTVLRVIDKMSIQRKLLLQYKDGDVFIFPFESPYVSEAQLLLKNRELIF